MNTQKQITIMVTLVFLLLAGCAAYTVYDQPREDRALAAQQATLADRGARIFARYCRQCHGDAGQGRIGPALNRPDLQDPNTRQVTQRWVTDTITCGRIGKIMPPWAISEGGALDTEQIRDLVALITNPVGNAWQKAAEYSAEENKTAPEPSVEDVLKSASITGANGRVCGQLAPTPEASAEANQPPAGVNPQTAWTEVTTDNKFSVTDIVVPVGQPVTIDVQNKGNAIHNMDILDQSGSTLKDASGKDLKTDLLQSGQEAKLTFTLNAPGTYKFQCDVHPTEMVGKVYAVQPGSGGAAATPAAAQATTSPDEVATDNKFSATTIVVPAGKPVTLNFQNKGTAIHNWDVLNVKDDSGKDIKTDLIQGGQSAKITFTISKPGTYKFQCDVHPTEMIGQLIVQ